MARRHPLCLLLGHKWSRQRLPNRTVRLTCQRCGEVDIVDRDLDVHPGGGGGF